MTTGAISAISSCLALGLFVILVALIFGKHSKSTNFGELNTCGRQSVTKPTNAENDSQAAANSARAGEIVNSRRPPLDNAKFLKLDEQWPNSEPAVGKQLLQDEALLTQNYTWEASAEENNKFETMKINTDQVIRAANIKPGNFFTESEEPSYSKVKGLQNPMLDIYHRNSSSSDIKFGNSCAWFGGTDSYYNARREVTNCDCLTEECDNRPPHN